MWVFEPVLFLVYFSFLWKCVERISVLSIKQWNEDQIRRNVRYYSNILLSRVIPILLHSDCVKLLYVIVSVDMVGIWDLVCVCVCAGRICIHSHVLPTKQHSFDNVNCVLYVCVRFFSSLLNWCIQLVILRFCQQFIWGGGIEPTTFGWWRELQTDRRLGPVGI